MSTPSTGLPVNPNTLLNPGLGIANIAFPGAGSAINLSRVVVSGVISLYDQIMAARPENLTEEQWLAVLKDPVHDPELIDRLIKEARADASPVPAA